MKTSLISVVTTLSALFAFSVSADPIEDLNIQAYKAGWFPNYVQGQILGCKKACGMWTGMPAEFEVTNDIIPSKEYAFVCKITPDPAVIIDPQNNPDSHWVYGTQFDDEPVCHAGTPWGYTLDSELFMCLCDSN